ncbi:hypothetical protein [Cytobacillus firmus]|uniref:hypothetical protein n=1 Tax=Cytobacillus firmus TaxID=1399 RepID=UPI0018CFD603|nr:hypothetical protein [Cytobacillus firmus]MBG9548512.1 hypothetical protein [Cytobacillus firmus]MBG9602935.1 hypothetical protein [Cytobacillus firmus]MBG9654880.1 hypothetical protein [Cytobacillus firmus]MED1906113.1 hypothetical protein [Cytobacillus firmus]MED1941528.1 hypothetical protein [Cytobacillus firmus]
MAFDLRARLSLDGSRFSNALRRITRETERANQSTRMWRDSQGRLRDEMGRFARYTDRSTSSMSRFGRAFSSPIKAIGSLTTSLNGLIGAYAAAAGARKIFEETIGAAAKYEQSTVTISAILNDAKLGKQYMKLVDQFAVDSPIMNSQDMLANSKSFLTITKDMKQLEKAWSLVERMAAIDPYQGVEGAVFALREMFSGDAISMVRRFEFPRAVMNEIKKLDVPDQLEALDKYFNKIGMTQKLIEDMGGTTLGIWAQIKEQLQVIFRDMGAPALTHIKSFLDTINNGLREGGMSGFQQTGARMLENLAKGFTNAALGIGKWIQSIQNNPEFQAQTTLFGQVKWVIEDVYQRFVDWLNNGGQTKIAETASTLIQILTASIEASMNYITPVAVKVGSALASGVIDGFSSSFSDSWIAQLIQDPVGFALKKATGGKLNLLDHGKRTKDKLAMKGAAGPLPYNGFDGITRQVPKRNGGVKYVPRDGAEYSLHRGEMILPRGEADNYRKGKSVGSVTISGNTFYLSGIDGNLEKAADQLMEILASKIEAAGGAGA